jgi:zinc transport system substrate-binding protein
MRLTTLTIALPLMLVAGCAGGGTAVKGRVDVVASAYPFAWLASQVGGSDVVVTDLVKPGAEPHDIELSPRQVGTLQQAAVVVYIKGFQAAVDDALGGGTQGFDLGTVVTQQPLVGGQEATGKDPHVWLDPVRMQTAATTLADRLAAKDPAHAAGYKARAATLVTKLAVLDTTFRTALKGCARKDIVTSHSAFGYLAARYGLVQKGISGLSPDAEPSPKRIAGVATFAKQNHVTTIFFESLIDPKVAKTVASEIGAKTAVLDPVEGVRGGDDYLSVQTRNAAALHTALGCT